MSSATGNNSTNIYVCVYTCDARCSPGASFLVFRAETAELGG